MLFCYKLTLQQPVLMAFRTGTLPSQLPDPVPGPASKTAGCAFAT